MSQLARAPVVSFTSVSDGGLVFSIVTDFIGAAFPVLLLWNARLPLRQKVALNLLMGLGIMCVLFMTIPMM